MSLYGNISQDRSTPAALSPIQNVLAKLALFAGLITALVKTRTDDEATIADLKGQVATLKGELGTDLTDEQHAAIDEATNLAAAADRKRCSWHRDHHRTARTTPHPTGLPS